MGRDAEAPAWCFGAGARFGDSKRGLAFERAPNSGGGPAGGLGTRRFGAMAGLGGTLCLAIAMAGLGGRLRLANAMGGTNKNGIGQHVFRLFRLHVLVSDTYIRADDTCLHDVGNAVPVGYVRR